MLSIVDEVRNAPRYSFEVGPIRKTYLSELNITIQNLTHRTLQGSVRAGYLQITGENIGWDQLEISKYINHSSAQKIIIAKEFVSVREYVLKIVPQDLILEVL